MKKRTIPPVTTMRLPPKLMADLTVLAAERGVSRTSIVRSVLHDYVQSAKRKRKEATDASVFG